MAAQRHVRRLRLACARQEQARHGQILLEDALRTASFGDEGRLIIVRKLDLGRVSTRASATQWSRRLEESYRNLRTPPVSVLEPTAERAAAVYFANANEPWLLLAERTALGRTCHEWYWRAALPRWKSAEGSVATLRFAFAQLVRGGLGLTLQLGVRLARRAVLAPLLQALTNDDFAPLKTALGLPVTAVDRVISLTPPQTPSTEPILVGSDLGRYWLAAVALAQSQAARDGTPALLSPTAEAIRRQVLSANRPHDDLRTDESRNSAIQPATAEIEARGSQLSDTDSPTLRPKANAGSPREAERVFTRAGGLFFLLPLLARAGLPTFIRSLPESERRQFPWQVLRLALRHARTEEADPLRRQLVALPSTQAPLGRWLLAANRLSLRGMGLNLRQLIARSALVSVSSSHVDVFFRANDADIRVRRAGLDLDPGWVPWLERVVTYHFNRED